MVDKKKVAYIHMMKCGGTTMRYLITQEYAREAILPVAITPDSVAKPPYPFIKEDEMGYCLRLSPEDVAPYSLVMGHYDCRVLNLIDDDWHVMTLLRDPVRQLLSRYFFIQLARDLHGNEWEETCSKGFGYWLEHHAERYANHQTEMLGLGDVDDAIALLEDKRMVFGLVERMGESMKLFNRKFGWSLINYARHNRAPVDTDSYEISPDEMALARELQSDDMVLYQRAVELFQGYN